MTSLHFVLILLAFLLLLAEALCICTPRVKLGWLGLALWMLAVLLGTSAR
jgi:hypothetical protein